MYVQVDRQNLFKSVFPLLTPALTRAVLSRKGLFVGLPFQRIMFFMNTKDTFYRTGATVRSEEGFEESKHTAVSPRKIFPRKKRKSKRKKTTKKKTA